MASIVVAGDTSGTVTLTAPLVAGTTTLTLPTTNGTLITTGSTTGVNASAISTGTLAAARLPTGSVLQVVTTQFTTPTTGTGQYVDIGFSATITPTSSSSRILVLSTVSMSTGGTTVGYSIYRNGSICAALNGVASGIRPAITVSMGVSNGEWNYAASYSGIDSPATTSAVTYSIRMGSFDGRAWQVNRNGNNSNDGNWDSAQRTSSLVLLEIAS